MIWCMNLSLCPNHILIFSQNLEAHDHVSSLQFLCYIIVKGRVFILLGWSWPCGSLNLPVIQQQIWWRTREISGFSYSSVCLLQITTQPIPGLLITLTMLTLSYLQLLIMFSKLPIYCHTPLASESVGLWMNHFFQLCEILSDIVSDRGPLDESSCLVGVKFSPGRHSKPPILNIMAKQNRITSRRRMHCAQCWLHYLW